MIKQLIGTLIFSLLVLAIQAQTSQDAVKKQDSNYWSKQVDLDPANNNAWINLYFNKRNDLQKSTAKDLNKSNTGELKEIEEELEEVLPNSAALGYVQFLNSNFTDEAALNQAISLDPNNALIQEQAVNMHTIKKETSARSSSLMNLKSKGHLSNPEIEYAKNVLRSIETGGVLLMNAEEDAHPLFYCQDVMQFRTDVQVVFLDLLQNETYAQTIAKAIDQKETYLAGYDRTKQISKIISSKHSKLYLSLTLDNDLLRLYSKGAYVTGLVMRVDAMNKLNNLAILEEVWDLYDFQYLMDHQSKVNRNYLLPMVQLHKYKKNKGVYVGDLEQQIRQLGQSMS